MKKISFEFKLAVMAIGAIALLCLTLQVYFQDYQKIGREIGDLNDIYQRSTLLNQIVITAHENEFSHNNYLQHGEEQDLREYYESSFKLPVILDKLDSAYSNRNSESDNLKIVREIVTRQQKQFGSLIAAYQLNPKAVLSPVNADKTGFTKKISTIVSAMLSNEGITLQEEQNLHNIRSQLQIKLYLVGSMVVLAILAICMSLIIKEVRENRKLAQQLEHNATHDFLTGLPNRSYFVQALKHTLARARREDTLAAIFFLDLNGFKAINDTYGHEIGDLVLIRVAEKLRATMRDSDILGRLGGDEFVILATRLKAREELDILTAKIEAAMHSITLPFIKEQQLSTSIGHALIPEDGDSADILLAHADKNMYAHKKSSKTKVNTKLTLVNR